MSKIIILEKTMNALTVSLVSVMFPGVIMAMIYDTYTQHKPWDSFRYILMSLVFGILTYLSMQLFIAIYQGITGIKELKTVNWKILSVWSLANGEQKISVNPIEVLFGGVLSIPLGLIAVYLSSKRTLHEYLLQKGISKKYGDDNAFIRSIELMCLETKDCYIFVREDNVVIHGTVQLYNESDKTQEIGLSNATVYDADTSDIILKTNYLYLSKEFGKLMLFKNYLNSGENDGQPSE